MLVEILRIDNLQCGAVWWELSCVWMRCGAACGQGLRTQRSKRMHFFVFRIISNAHPGSYLE